jgi:hypothetical protein
LALLAAGLAACGPEDATESTKTVTSALTPPANTSANLYFHGGPIFNKVINVLYWGVPAADVSDTKDYLDHFAAYVNGNPDPLGPGSPTDSLPPGYDPAIRTYGIWGVKHGVEAVSPSPYADDGPYQGRVGPPNQVTWAQSLGMLPPSDVSQMYLVIVPPSANLGSNTAGFHDTLSGAQMAVVQSRNWAAIAHEILETTSDPALWNGWATNEGFNGWTHNEGADGGCNGGWQPSPTYGPVSPLWVASSGASISGVSAFTVDMAFPSYPGHPTDSCQIYVPEQYAPIAVAHTGNDVKAYAIGPDGHMHRYNGVFSTNPFQQTDLGQPPTTGLAGKPSVITYYGNDFIFVRGADNQLWFTYGTGGGWANFGSPNGNGFYGNPSTVVWNNGNNINVFVLGTDQMLWSFYWDGSQWAWGGVFNNVFSGPPIAISRSASTIDVFLAGVDLQLYRVLWDGSWHQPEKVGGSSVLAPIGVSSWGPDRLDIFSKGDLGPSSSSVRHIGLNGSTWQAWDSRSVIAVGNSGSIATASTSPDHVDAFVIDTGVQQMYHTAYAPESGWVENRVPLATGATGDPVAVATGGSYLSLHVFYRDVSGGLHQMTRLPGGWIDNRLAYSAVR